MKKQNKKNDKELVKDLVINSSNETTTESKEINESNPWALHKLVDKKPYHTPTASNTLYTSEKGSESL